MTHPHPLHASSAALLADLVACPSVSADSNLPLLHLLADRLEAAGFAVEILHDPSGAKGNLWATLGPAVDGGLVLSGHSDVVPVTDQVWATDPFVLHDDGVRMFGRGTCDMKGFIAAVTAWACANAGALRAATRRRPLHLAFTHDEEVGCLGGQALLRDLAARGLRPRMAIIGEPTGLRPVEGHKGCCEYTTRFTGREGHGSVPDAGVNAVEYAARYVGRLMALAEQLRARAPRDSRFDPPWTTINTGALHGGVAHNVIPGTARLDWEMRPVTEADADHVRADLAAYCRDHLLPAMRAVDPDASIETEVVGEVAGLRPMADNAARDLVMALTGANGAGLVPFGTEAGLFQALGMDVVICGPGDIAQAHRPDEFLSHDQLGRCLAMLDGLGGWLGCTAGAAR